MELNILNIGILTWLTFLPVIGMIIVLLLPKEQKTAIRLSLTILFYGVRIVLLLQFRTSQLLILLMNLRLTFVQQRTV